MASDVDRSSDANTFIGRGIAFPMRVDHTGSIAMVSGPQDIDRSIVMVLSTAKGERTPQRSPPAGLAAGDLPCRGGEKLPYRVSASSLRASKAFQSSAGRSPRQNRIALTGRSLSCHVARP